MFVCVCSCFALYVGKLRHLSQVVRNLSFVVSADHGCKDDERLEN